MKVISFILLTLITAGFLAGCQPAATNTATNTTNAGNSANSNAAKTATAAAPTKDALMGLEKAGWEAWKNRDAKWSQDNYSDKVMNISSTGRLDKAGAIKAFNEQKCEIKSYTLSDDQMQMVGPDVAVLTFRAAQDYVCDGKKGPADVRSASIYVREGDTWKAAFYAETPVVDPKAPPAKPASLAKTESKAEESKPDAATEAVLAQERKIWEGWKTKDAKMLDDVLGKDFMFLMGDGRHDRAGSIKMWSTDNKCDIKNYTISEPKTSALTSDVTLLTYKGGAEGACEGQPIMTEWYGAVFRKEGEVWRPAFGTGVPVS